MDELGQKCAILVGLAENFGKEMPPSLSALWLKMLGNVSADTLSKAAIRVMETYEFKTLPPFAVLKAAIDDVEGIGKQDIEISGERAWRRLLGKIAEYGPYNEPRHDPITKKALGMMGGWSVACRWLESEIPWHRKAFIAYHTSALSSEAKQALYGLPEATARTILAKVEQRSPHALAS